MVVTLVLIRIRFEAGMERLLDLDSGREFIGRAALLGIREAGVRRRIVGIELLGEPLEQGTFTERWPVTKIEEIGEVLVALYSPQLKKNIGYAMIAIEHSSVGSCLLVDSPLGSLKARVVHMPFVKAVKD